MPTSTRAPSSELLPTAIGSARSHKRSRGFTLLELTIVLLIIGIAASFVIPRWRDTDSAALAASAARLATTARYLYEEAAFRRLPMRLNLDLDNNAYWVTVLNDDTEDPEFVPEPGTLARPTALPEAVTFADVVLPALGTVKEGVVFAQFSPEGYADALVVHLQNRRSEYATFAIEPLSGRTRVAEGYYDVDRVGSAARADELEAARNIDDEGRALDGADRTQGERTRAGDGRGKRALSRTE